MKASSAEEGQEIENFNRS